MILTKIDENEKIECVYDSSNIVASSYDKNTNDLVVTFKRGTQYRYNRVTKTDYTRFEIAESQGKVLNSHIKKYSFTKLDDVNVDELIETITEQKKSEADMLIEALKIKMKEYLESNNKQSLKEISNIITKVLNE